VTGFWSRHFEIPIHYSQNWNFIIFLTFPPNLSDVREKEKAHLSLLRLTFIDLLGKTTYHSVTKAQQIESKHNSSLDPWLTNPSVDYCKKGHWKFESLE